MQNKRLILWIIASVFMLNTLSAQQEAQVSHNMFNHMAINPGFAGLQGSVEITGITRQQWQGFRDEKNNRVGPESYLLTAHLPIPFLAGGLSLGVLQDNLGHESTAGLHLGYAYHMQGFGGRIGLGLQVGFLDKAIDFGALTPIIPNDPLLNQDQGESQIFADLGLGIFYLGNNQRWAGISVTQILQTKGPNSGGQLRRHAYLSFGSPFNLAGAPDMKIIPSILVKSDFHSLQFDINATLEYNNRLWGGVSYRLQDAIVILLGFNIGQFRIGYSYDITTSAIGRSARSHGSHEIMVRYSFDLLLDRVREVQRNVRFL